MKTSRFSLRFWLISCLFALTLVAVAQQKYSPRAQERITREVRHKLLMLPNYGGPFDHLGFKLTGYDVVLIGQVTHATLKDDAENAIKNIEGVERVENKIQILPPSPGDDRLRHALFRAIYGYPTLQRYGVGSNRPIHILVNGGRVILEGVVDRQSDKDLVGMRANGVPGVFSVTNNLQVASDKKSH